MPAVIASTSTSIGSAKTKLRETYKKMAAHTPGKICGGHAWSGSKGLVSPMIDSRTCRPVLVVCVVFTQSFACGGSVGADGLADAGQFADAPSPSQASLSGTSIPGAPQIVDANLVVWTVNNGASYENGVPDSGTNIAQLLYFDGSIYANNTSNEWWTYANGWTQIAGDPVVESQNGTSVPGANQLVDARGVIWAVRDGDSYEDGVADGGSNIVQLLYYNGSIYANNTSNEWWTYANGWTQIAGDPRAAMDVAAGQGNPTSPSGDHLVGGCGSCDGVAPLLSFESFINRPVDYVLVWGWAQTASDLMFAFHYLEGLWPNNYTLHYDVPMVLSGGTFQQVYGGSFGQRLS